MCDRVPMNILVASAGSSSLELRVVDATDTVIAAADLPAPDGNGDAGLRAFVAEAPDSGASSVAC